jgi:catechol 2,3-dioxygenase-like lactoylglutathione lyase family enzyme
MTTIPLFPITSLDETLAFYQALGFEVTYRQDEPYLYASVSRDDTTFHFSRLSMYGAKNAFGAVLVFVPNVNPVHATFADGLRSHYGKVPTAGVPRISRLFPGQTRFRLFDPSGNILTYINHDEPDADWSAYETPASPLLQALENAVFLRDTYGNDTAAAKVLDKALDGNKKGSAMDRARVLAARAELAVALGEAERAEVVQRELQQIELSEEERDQYRHELDVAERTAQWITGAC